MARRELFDVAAAVAGSFVSRNNDVNGYWSLGLLRSHADRNCVRFLRFDIIEYVPGQNSDSFALVTDAYQRILNRQLIIRKIGRAIVTKAEILLTFDPGAPNPPSASTYGAPFSCTVRLTDHRGREFACTRTGCCAPHCSLRERRSARAKQAQ